MIAPSAASGAATTSLATAAASVPRRGAVSSSAQGSRTPRRRSVCQYPRTSATIVSRRAPDPGPASGRRRPKARGPAGGRPPDRWDGRRLFGSLVQRATRAMPGQQLARLGLQHHLVEASADLIRQRGDGGALVVAIGWQASADVDRLAHHQQHRRAKRRLALVAEPDGNDGDAEPPRRAPPRPTARCAPRPS